MPKRILAYLLACPTLQISPKSDFDAATSVTRQNRQMSIKVAQNIFH